MVGMTIAFVNIQANSLLVAKMIRSKLAAGIVAIALVNITSVAHASIIGTEVTVTNTFNGLLFAGPVDVTVTDGVELTNFADSWSIDISENRIRFFDPGDELAFDVLNNNDDYLFSNIDWGGVPGEIVEASVASVVGLGTSPIVTFTADSINVRFPTLTDLTAFPELEAVISFEVAKIPEPATIALVGAGLAGLGVSARRRRKG